MANIVYIAASLDGFIARNDGNVDWLNEIPNPEGSDYGFGEFIRRIDAVVMGRKTFEIVLSFGGWPYTKPVFVLSTALTSLPKRTAGKAEIIKGKPGAVVRELNSRGYKNLYIDGGKTIQAFLKEDLIDEIILTRIPVLLGKGIPLFGELKDEQKYEHKETVVFNNALVKSSYIRVKSAGSA